MEKDFYRIITFGCKVNQVDTAGLSQTLEDQGWFPAPPGSAANLHLVNTCTVTSRADQQARQAIRRLARNFPDVPICVTGCYAQRAPAELALLNGVTLVLGNQEKFHLTEIFKYLLQKRPAQTGGTTLSPLASSGESRGGDGVYCAVGGYIPTAPFQPWRLRSFPGHARAWLKIQEGCSHHCSYCIVPQVRGPRRSWAPDEVMAAMQALTAGHHQEVVLTGIDLGQYGQDFKPAASLAALVRRLKQEELPFRVRLSSLEPQEVTEELLRELTSWRAFCPHFHLPLQSGAPEVLAAMNRPYRAADFRDLAADITRRFPSASLGLDLLAGFPTEAAADFEATHNFVAALPITYLHVFPFSPRPGTPAAAFKLLPGTEVQRRAALLRELGRLKKQKFLQNQVGQVREVLVERPARQKGWLQGLTDNYLRIIFPGPVGWRHRRVLVHFSEVQEETLVGQTVDAMASR